MRATSTSFTLVASACLSLGASLLVGCGGAAGDDTATTTKSGSTESALSSRASGCVPPLPSPTLEVPAGNHAAFHYDAVGVQIYACTPSAAGFAWVFQAPEATLYTRHGRVAGTHFAGPTWQANDGSSVVGAKLAAATPDPTAIPWLLLGAASHAGTGKMDDVTFVQRLETTGGIAPATGCDATTVGASARVPYTATYYFYEADGACHHGGDDHDDCDDHHR